MPVWRSQCDIHAPSTWMIILVLIIGGIMPIDIPFGTLKEMLLHSILLHELESIGGINEDLSISYDIIWQSGWVDSEWSSLVLIGFKRLRMIKFVVLRLSSESTRSIIIMLQCSVLVRHGVHWEASVFVVLFLIVNILAFHLETVVIEGVRLAVVGSRIFCRQWQTWFGSNS